MGDGRQVVPGVVGGERAGEVAIVTRSGMVESRHVGHGVLVGPDGEVASGVGDPSTLLLPRSALKPWQAATIRRCGAAHAGEPLDGEALAIAAGSHTGMPPHRDLVASMLNGAGLGEDDLQCPPALPRDDHAGHELLRAGGGPRRVAHNCSGKHAGMLLACVANGWPTDGYLDAAHPLQVAVRVDLEAALAAPVAHVAVDGCGAPAFAVSLPAFARAAAAFAKGDEHQRAVFDAMRAHPWAVDGPGWADTEVMLRLPGVAAKGGAEGVQVLMADGGWAAVVKVADGAYRAAMPAALALLDRVPGLDVADALAATHQAVPGGDREVGAVLPSPHLTPPTGDADSRQ